MVIFFYEESLLAYWQDLRKILIDIFFFFFVSFIDYFFISVFNLFIWATFRFYELLLNVLFDLF